MSEPRNESKVSERSWVSIGMAISLFVAFSGGVWWAATVNSKLDSLIKLYSTLTQADSELAVKYVTLKERVDRIELVGSPNVLKLQDRIDYLCNEVTKLKLKEKETIP